jgi:hypothetical protein
MPDEPAWRQRFLVILSKRLPLVATRSAQRGLLANTDSAHQAAERNVDYASAPADESFHEEPRNRVGPSAFSRARY